MRIIVKVFWYFGLMFWSVFLFVGLLKLLAYNGLGELFVFNAAEVTSIAIIQDSSHVNIDYTYVVNDSVYYEDYRMVNEYYNECDVDDTLRVMYNDVFNRISYIEGIPLKQRQAKIWIYISSFFIVCLFFLGKRALKSRITKSSPYSGTHLL